ncbi:Fic family protein [Pseudoalteromonas sp. S3260]|uniref:Fic family protein n=1 Tax=Pseudoalteromonas sp. S3260 TaxID=579534 RepID=UPI0032E48BA0
MALINIFTQSEKPLNRQELQNLLGLKDRKHFRERYLKPAIEAGIIEMTIPEKPNSKMQQYKLTQTS